MLTIALRSFAAATFACVAALFGGCSEPPPPPPGPPAPPTTATPATTTPATTAPGTSTPGMIPPGTITPTASGKACKANAECPSGEMCAISAGCDTPGTCVQQHMCTQNLVEYCGCDGQTFRSSGTCPSKPFKSRGACPAPSGSDGAPPPPGTKKACNSDADCTGGEQCQGTEGCGAPWTCGPPRRCTRDSVEWCGCDGTTFRGSGTCPSKPVRRRGKC